MTTKPTIEAAIVGANHVVTTAEWNTNVVQAATYILEVLAGTNTDKIPAAALTGGAKVATGVLIATATNIVIPLTGAPYNNARITFQGRGDGATVNEVVALQFNGDTGTNYDTQYMRAANATASNSTQLAQGSAMALMQPGANSGRAALFGAATITIPRYTGTVAEKSFHAEGGIADSIAANSYAATFIGSWRNTSAITTVKLIPLTSTNFVIGTSWALEEY